MSNNNDKMLFLRLAQGGQLTPEMMQMMQQSGQLPQMDMGANLNDIQRMNMKQQSHYGNSMFRYGGVPYRANGGEQEETDQQFLSPDKKYSGRVQDFLKDLKARAMNVVQDEMLNTANDYDQEAASIDMQNQMRYGGMYAPGGMVPDPNMNIDNPNMYGYTQPPMFNPAGVDAANAWLKAGQDTQVDMTENLGTLAGSAAGLQGFFSNSDTDAFNNNAYNSNPMVKSTITDLETGKRERIRMAPGGQPNWQQQLFQGTPMTQSQPQVQIPYAVGPTRANGEAYDAQTIANAKVRGWGNDVAGYEAAGWVQKSGTVDPTLATTTKKKKETPAAKTKLTPEQEAAAKVKAEQEARIAEETKKAEEDKKKKEEEGKTEDKKTEETKTEDKKTTDVGDGNDIWRALADPNSTQAGAYYQLDKKGNKIPMAFYDPNMRITSSSAEYRTPFGNLFRSKENDRSGVMKKSTYTFGTLDSPTQVPNIQLDPNAQVPAANNGNNQTWAAQYFPQVGPNAPATTYPGGPYPATTGSLVDDAWAAKAKEWRPGMTWEGPANMLPNQMSGYQPAPVQQQPVPLPGPLTVRQARQQGRQQVADAKTQAAIDKINAAATKAYGGGLRRFFPGGPTTDLNDAGIGMDNAFAITNTNNEFSNFTAPGPTYGNGPLDKPMEIGKIYQTPGISNEKQVDNKYRKENPFLVPGIMAGLDVIGGAAANADANRMTQEAMGKFSADQVYGALPEKSGSKGDYDPNSGILRPNDYVPTQFQGYNFQSNYAANGGEMSEGDEMYLDEDTINAILAAGGQIEYLD